MSRSPPELAYFKFGRFTSAFYGATNLNLNILSTCVYDSSDVLHFYEGFQSA